MTNRNFLISYLRKNLAFKLAGRILKSELIKPIVFRVISQTWYSYKGKSLSKNFSKQRLKFKAGDRLPYFPEDSIYLNFTEASFHLLHISDYQMNEKQKQQIPLIFPFQIQIVEEKLGEKWKKLGVQKELFVLVRPDNYIAFVADMIDAKSWRIYLNRYFSLML